MTPQSVADLIKLVSSEYWTLKNTTGSKIKSENIFQRAAEKVYNIWGQRFGLASVSDLKSLYGSRKKFTSPTVTPVVPNNATKTQFVCRQPILEDPLWKEIQDLNLNPETYFF